jgi:hypothetical protein
VVSRSKALPTIRRTTRAAKSIREPLDDDFTLSPAQNRELVRRVRDTQDRKRFLLASVFLRKSLLFYDVSTDTYLWKDPRGATLFKRRAAALAIKRLLRGDVRVIECKVDRRDRLIVASVRVDSVGGSARARLTERRQPTRSRKGYERGNLRPEGSSRG